MRYASHGAVAVLPPTNTSVAHSPRQPTRERCDLRRGESGEEAKEAKGERQTATVSAHATLDAAVSATACSPAPPRAPQCTTSLAAHTPSSAAATTAPRGNQAPGSYYRRQSLRLKRCPPAVTPPRISKMLDRLTFGTQHTASSKSSQVA